MKHLAATARPIETTAVGGAQMLKPVGRIREGVAGRQTEFCVIT